MLKLRDRIRPPKKWMIWMGAVAGISLIVLGISIAMGPEEKKQTGSAKTNAMRPKATATVGGSPATDAYNEKLMAQNEQLAEKAKKEGKSFVPTVVGERRPTAVTKVEQKPELPKEIPETKRPPVKEKPRTHRRNDDSQRAMKEYMALLLKDTKQVLTTESNYQPAEITNFTVAENPNAQDDKNLSKQARQESDNQLPPLPFKSGDLLYASNEIHLNSDVPSPVVASIVSGAFKGTMFFGNFKRHEKFVLLRFDRLRTPAGDEYQVDAIALDPDSSSAAVRSAVDSHYLERWGGLIAASFLEGFGEARSRSGQSYQSSQTTETFTYPEYSVEDEAWIAAGKVGQRLANIMEQGFSRPPTVYEYSGEMFAIMILSTKR